MQVRFIVCFFLLITNITFGQQPTDDDVKKAISKVFGIFNAIRADHGTFIMPGEYVVENGKLIGQRYTENNFSITYRGGNTGVARPEVVGNLITAITLEPSNCLTERMGPDWYDIELSPDGFPVKVSEKNWANAGKGFEKRFYVLEYTNGKLVKVTGNRMKGEGKSIRYPKVTGEEWRFVTEYNWNTDGNKLQVLTKTFMGINQKGNEIPPMTEKYNYTYGDNSMTIEKFQSGSLIEKWDYVKNENEVRLTKQYFFSKQTHQDVCSIKDGKVVKQEHWEYGANNSFISHNLQEHTYELKDPTWPTDQLCGYKTTTLISIYNATGEVIEEHKGGQGRHKNPDGTWGEWHPFRM